FPARSNNLVNTSTGAGQFRNANLYPTLNAAEFNQFGGRITSGFNLTMSVPGNPANTLILYTIDGSDPRLPYSTGFAAGATAELYGGPVPLSETVHVKARAFNTSTNIWSALTEATFSLDISALRITEINFNPLAPATGPTTADDYEFIELQNTGATPTDVAGVKISGGIDFTFHSTTIIPGGDRAPIA